MAKAEVLRLIYQGRFLHNNVTLGALGLPLGKTTVMHLVPRENLPEPNSQGKAQCPTHGITLGFRPVLCRILNCHFRLHLLLWYGALLGSFIVSVSQCTKIEEEQK